MRKFECPCGGRTFFVNKKDGMIQCFPCRKKFKFENGAWVKFETVKELSKRIDDFIYKHGVSPYETVLESMGQWMKRNGIVKVKKKEVDWLTPNTGVTAKWPVVDRLKEQELKKKHIEKKWKTEIWGLKTKYVGTVTFPKNYHNGKLRGRDAARACHSDLKKIGIETDLNWRGNGAAILELKK